MLVMFMKEFKKMDIFFLGHSEWYLLIFLLTDRRNLKTNTSCENMTSCPPCSQAAQLSRASPRSTAAFNRETDVLFSDMAFVLAFDLKAMQKSSLFRYLKLYLVHCTIFICNIQCILVKSGAQYLAFLQDFWQTMHMHLGNPFYLLSP